MDNVAVITVIYKFPKKDLRKFIRDVKNQGILDKSIFVHDNTKNNIGYAPAINKILRKIRNEFDFFLIVNPDIVFRKNCIKNLYKKVHLKKELGIVGPAMVTSGGRLIYGGSLDRKRYSSILKETSPKKVSADLLNVEYVSGSAMFIRKEVFEEIGLFHEDYFIYYEEIDFCLRAKKKGFKIAIVPSAEIVHLESKTVGKKSSAMDYYMARNHLLFVERFAPFDVKLYELLRIPLTLYEARDRKFELLGIKDYFKRSFGRNLFVKNTVDL